MREKSSIAKLSKYTTIGLASWVINLPSLIVLKKAMRFGLPKAEIT